MVEMQLDILGSHKHVPVRCMISTLESGVQIVKRGGLLVNFLSLKNTVIG